MSRGRWRQSVANRKQNIQKNGIRHFSSDSLDTANLKKWKHRLELLWRRDLQIIEEPNVRSGERFVLFLVPRKPEIRFIRDIVQHYLGRSQHVFC